MKDHVELVELVRAGSGSDCQLSLETNLRAVFNTNDMWWPLRVALAFQITGDVAFANRARIDRRFDKLVVMVGMLCQEMVEAGAIIECQGGWPRRAIVANNPKARFARLAADFSAMHFEAPDTLESFKFAELQRHFIGLYSDACSQACEHIANVRLHAKGVPMKSGVEDFCPPRSIRPSDIISDMSLGKVEANGVIALCLGPTPLWASVEVPWDEWLKCFSDTEAVRSVVAHIPRLHSLRKLGGRTSAIGVVLAPKLRTAEVSGRARAEPQIAVPEGAVSSHFKRLRPGPQDLGEAIRAADLAEFPEGPPAGMLVITRRNQLRKRLKGTFRNIDDKTFYRHGIRKVGKPSKK